MIGFYASSKDINRGSYRIWIHDLMAYFRELGVRVAFCDKTNDLSSFEVIILDKEDSDETSFFSTNAVHAKIGCINLSANKTEVPADFVIVGSNEEKISLSWHPNVFIFPLIERNYQNTLIKHHEKKDLLRLCYHGNHLHLSSFQSSGLTRAITRLGGERKIQLDVITPDPNKKWEIGQPDNITIMRRKWNVQTIIHDIQACDIGLVPNALCTQTSTDSSIQENVRSTGISNLDFQIRFKNKSNAGRCFVFHQLGIPVVADITPSHFHILGNPKNGFLAMNEDSWYESLNTLTKHQIRTQIAVNAKREFDRLYNPLEWAKVLLGNINELDLQATRFSSEIRSLSNPTILVDAKKNNTVKSKFNGGFSLARNIIGNKLRKFKVAHHRRERLKIVFLVRRYHTNMIPMVESLLQAGHEVSIMASTREVIEDYTILKPIELTKPFDADRACGSLPFQQPDLVLIREKSDEMLQIASKFEYHGARLIHYEQKPLRRQKGWNQFITDMKRLRSNQLKGVPLNLITPIDYFDSILQNQPKKLLTQKFNFPVYTPTTPSKTIETGQRSRLIHVLMVGKLAQPRKRHFWLIDALESSGVSCRLTICGAGNDIETSNDGTRSLEYYQAIKSRALEKKPTNRLEITLNANLSFAEMGELYLASDVFVLPSESELFGISVLEAMASGCAAITANSNGSAHHITHEVDGMVFKEQDFEDFKNCVHRILKDTCLRKSIQRSAPLTTQKNHNYEQFARFIENLI